MSGRTKNNIHITQRAGEVVQNLSDFVAQNLNTPRSHIAVVLTAPSGTPPTISIALHDQTVPAVRYIGNAPAVGASVLVLADGPFYVCVGALAE